MASTIADRLNGVNGGAATKKPVLLATTANITLSGEQSIDGIITSESDVLVKNQTDTKENGIYTTGSGAWIRRSDSDGVRDLVRGSLVFVNDGDVNGGTYWSLQASADPILPGITQITFTNFVNIVTSNLLEASITSPVDGEVLYYDGEQWVNQDIKALDLAFSGNNSFTGTTDFQGIVKVTGKQLQLSKGADVASASSLPILTDGNFFDVTGTTTITSIATSGEVGTKITLQFDGILTLTHHATDLILPSGANITTAAGDVAEFVEYASGDWVCVNYERASGRALVESVIPSGTPVTTTGGTSVDFPIPVGVRRITLNLSGISTSGTNFLIVQLGSGSVETSGYLGTCTVIAGASQATQDFTTGFGIRSDSAALAVHGRVVLERLSDSHLWVSTQLASASGGNTYFGAGSKTFSSYVDILRLTTVGGTDTFDAMNANITYEF